MFARQPFPRMQNNSQRTYGFDLSAFLAAGETIIAAASTLTIVDGADPALALNPNVRFAVPVEFSTPQVTQLLVFNDPLNELGWNDYQLSIAARTSLGQIVSPWAEFGLDPSLFPTLSFPGGTPPATAGSFLLPAPAEKFILPVYGGLASQAFPVADPGETLLYGFDFSPALSPSETISAATAGLILSVGTDATIPGTPTAYNVGSPTISGSIVQQMLAWPTPPPGIYANGYTLAISATTSSDQVILGWGNIAISASPM